MKWCLILDSHRGVYYGLVNLDEYRRSPTDYIEVQKFRHCFRFGTTQGVYQLVTTGPGKGASIGPELELIIVRDVSKVAPCTATAQLAFLEAKWSN